MLKSDVIWPASRRFRSNSEWEPVGFFSEALCNATKFDLKLGFFSSAAINVLADGFAAFLYNGGQMRLIINDILSDEDKDAIVNAHSNSIIPAFDLNNLHEIKETLSERGLHFFECLSWLIRNNKLDVKIIKPAFGTGIAHSKIGVFYDNQNKVAFDGSCNFSRSAFFENGESISAFCDWDGYSDSVRVSDIEKEFEETFSGNDQSVTYIDAKDIRTRISSTFENKEIIQLLIDEESLISTQSEKPLPQYIKDALSRAKANVKRIIEKIKNNSIDNVLSDRSPAFPYESPRDYQIEAFNNWKNEPNKQKGLFSMATGTGKTLTSLNCLLQIYKRYGYYKAIILVPTITLVNQWEQECRKFNFSNIIKVFSKNPNWKDEVERIKFDELYNSNKTEEPSFIIISTYASYARKNVFSLLNGFDKKRLLLIADECHNMGSSSIVKKLKEIPYIRRIGLSATPERQYDDFGNRKIKDFFGVQDNYTFDYGMKEAIRNGVLCQYYYYPHIVKLTQDEMDAYIEISEKISRYFNFNTCSFEDIDDVLKLLLLTRKRIIHKAYHKLEIFKSIMVKRYKEKGNLKYSLIYVPEGNKPDYVPGIDDFDIDEDIQDDNVADHLIDIFTKAVVDIDEKITVRKFISGVKDRDEILNDFANGKIQVLTSMKCLDEGVDVPRSELAIFCSSTGNPRQFIQRRGRVLRTHPDKKIAELHDLVVVPEVNPFSNSFKMEQSLLRGELERVKDFALMSENPSYTEMELRNVLDYYGLNLYNNNHIQ